MSEPTEAVARLQAWLDEDGQNWGQHEKDIDTLLDTHRASSDEVERLHSLAKDNNTLARMNGAHRDEWREKAVRYAEALEPFAELADEMERGRTVSVSDGASCRFVSTVGVMRNARAALSVQSGKGEA